MKKSNNSVHIRKLTAISVFCALAYICVFLIRFKVSFLTFDLKDAIMAIGSMYFGPVAAIAMPSVVSLIEYLTISDTGVYGLIMNFLSSFSFCLVSSLIYRFRKSISGAVIALVSAVAVMTGVMLLANIFITPYYMHVPMADVKALIPTMLFPFNLIKGIVNASVVMILYKPFSSALKSSGILTTIEGSAKTPLTKTKRILTVAVSAVILVAALLVLFLVLHATIE